MRTDVKPAFSVGSSRQDLRDMPDLVQHRVGQALYDAQVGRKAPHAKPLRGYRGAGVLEIVEDNEGDTYRAVYTVRFAGAVYVLHAFQKKSTRGIKTSASDRALIEQRLKEAEEHHRTEFARRSE